MGRTVFTISKAERKRLADKLIKELPGLAEDLAITEVRLDRTTRNDRIRRQSNDSGREPYDHQAAKAAKALNDELQKWVEFTMRCGTVLNPPANNSIPALGRWLARNVTYLALTPGSEPAPARIHGAIKWAWRAVDLPEEDEISVNPARVTDAHKEVVSASQAATLARHLGGTAIGLNKNRVHTLAKNHAVEPVDTKDGTHFFVFGDLLVAHATYTRRQPPKTKTKRKRKPSKAK
ncbi:hypothetical protein [Williamsia sp.]|uniref:hypothetical protein n=1 Tax=Williamsia sp. TaxID=1872085 RepID=UPI002F952D2F